MISTTSHAPRLTDSHIFLEHHQPNLIRTDQIASTIEQLLWTRESPKHHGNFDATLAAVTAASYAPEELVPLQTCISIRNEIAGLCSVREQRAPFNGKLGYTVDGTAPQQLLNPIEIHRLKVGGVPAIPVSWQNREDLQQCYVPSIYHLDAVISNMERLIYEHEWPMHRRDADINHVIRDPNYAAPDAIHRNDLLKIRNEWAKNMGLPSRSTHDYQPNGGEPPWLLRVDGEPLPNYVRDALKPGQFLPG